MSGRRSGFTLVELVVVLLCVAVGVGLLMMLVSERAYFESRRRTICASNLRAVGQSMATYSLSQGGAFPVAGRATEGGVAVGFREGDRVDPERAELDDNVTASLWMLVRDRSAMPESFVCPETTDQPDPMTRPGTDEPAKLRETRDFLAREHLSYSPINMYHQDVGERWTRASPSPSKVVLIGDNNASAHPERHVAGREVSGNHPGNSPNHGGYGQFMQFADGHVAWQETPFPEERGGWFESVHAMVEDGERKPVRLEHDAGDGGHLPLLPVHGNEGVSLSGERLGPEPLAPDARGPRARFPRSAEDLLWAAAPLLMGAMALVVMRCVKWVYRLRM